VQHTGEHPLDELTLQIYPHRVSRFEVYEDDGRTNAYRQGAYALTAVVCSAEGSLVVVEIAAPPGDRSVVPANRRYLPRLRLDRPERVVVDGAGELADTRRDTVGAGWWMDTEGFLCIRPGSLGPATVVITTGSSR
jgi:hypothetical protein